MTITVKVGVDAPGNPGLSHEVAMAINEVLRGMSELRGASIMISATPKLKNTTGDANPT